MYQTTSSYQQELTYSNGYEQAPSIVMQSSIQMSPYKLHTPQQMSPVPCMSVSAKPLHAASLPVPSPMSLNGYQSQLETPLMNSPNLESWNVNQSRIVPSLTLNDNALYNCNILEQLKGSYVIETPAGLDQVNVIVPAAENEDQYAIVRGVCSDGEALPDQFIHVEPTEFTLCSVDGNLEAILRKGSSMKHTVKWQNYTNGNWTIWRRKGEVTFKLVHVDSLATFRRNSVSSIDAVSTVFSSCFDSALTGPNGVPIRMRPELLQQSGMTKNRPNVMSSSSYLNYTPNNGSFQNKLGVGAPTNESDQQELVMLELIKAHCTRNASLRNRMIHWAMRNDPARSVSPDEVSTISEGRLWITAHATDLDQGSEIEESLQDSLDDIKGAYRHVQKGVFKQPEPQMNEPGVQHRLLKSRQGYWRIEANDVNRGKWHICAKELPDGRWLDMKNNGKLIQVQLIPMKNILQKMSQEFMPGNQEVEKSVEFLFTSCNQKKLNSRLKARSLKNNISNLKAKLGKQYALSFALEVATTADSIAEDLHC